jgi:putative transposase
VVHLVRSSLRYASKADWGKITAELKGVYTAATVAAAEQRFAEFAATWRDKYPAMVAMWERSWTEFVPFLDFPLPVRKLIYTTDESVNGVAACAGVAPVVGLPAAAA